MRNLFAALAAFLLAAPAAGQVIIPPPAPGGALASPDWAAAPADGDKGPAVGGRAYQRYRIATPTAVLASFDQVGRLTGAPSEASDVAADPLYGDTRITVTLASFNAIQLKPAAAMAAAVNATGQNVRVWTPLRIQGGVGEILARRFRCFRVSGLLMQPSSRLLA